MIVAVDVEQNQGQQSRGDTLENPVKKAHQIITNSLFFSWFLEVGVIGHSIVYLDRAFIEKWSQNVRKHQQGILKFLKQCFGQSQRKKTD